MAVRRLWYRLCLLWSSLDSGGCQIPPVASPASGRSVCLLVSAASAVGTCVVTKFCVWLSVAGSETCVVTKFHIGCRLLGGRTRVITKFCLRVSMCCGWDLCNHKVPVSSDLCRNPCGHQVPLPYSRAVPGGTPSNRPGLPFVVLSWLRVGSVQCWAT